MDGTSACFYRGKLYFQNSQNFQKISRFCQQERHTPARARTRQGAPRNAGTLPSPQPALPLPFVRCHVKHSPNNEVLLLPNEIQLTLCELQATYRPTLAGLLLPSCLIVISLLSGVWSRVWNNGTASAYVYRCSNQCGF